MVSVRYENGEPLYMRANHANGWTGVITESVTQDVDGEEDLKSSR